VFIKLGQLLSTRPDLVSPAYMQTFEGLQDRVAPAEPGQIRDTLAAYKEELGGWPFRSFDDEPVAAASLTQVHRARLRDGASVAVKVRRPGVVDRVLVDLRILWLGARLAQRYLARTEVYDLPGTVEELGRAFEDELDFRSEAESMEVFGRNLAEYQDLVVPRVYPRLTTPSVLVMEFIEGCPLREGGTLALPRKRRAAPARSSRHICKCSSSTASSTPTRTPGTCS
jgi:ubiquinone biosynthesis protein